MKKVARFLIDCRGLMLAVMLLLAVLCGLLIPKVAINKDRTKYLADDSNMKTGITVLNTAFPDDEKAFIRVMFDDLTPEQIPVVKERLAAIPCVTSVSYEPDSADYNRDNHTLFILGSRFDYNTDEERAIEEAVAGLSGEYTLQWHNDDIPSTEVPFKLILIVFLFGMAVLTLMSHSWLDPVLFLFTVGIAVVINMGTNLVLPHIDELTTAIGPILQFVLSMDYSIILMSRYRQEKELDPDRVSAMKTALAGSITSIASSALTTVAGLLALVFMSFKLGPELGIVLGKGVFISMLTVFTLLPALILACDRLLEKTRKKAPRIPMGGLAKFSLKARFVMPVTFVVLLAGSFLLQRLTPISFTEKNEDPLQEVFPKENRVVVLYRNAEEADVAAIVAGLEGDPRIKSIYGYGNTLGKALTADEMAAALGSFGGDVAIDGGMVRMLYMLYDSSAGAELTMTLPQLFDYLCDDLLTDARYALFFNDEMKASLLSGRELLADAVRQIKGENYARLILTSTHPDESAETYAYIDRVRDLCGDNLDEYYLVGNSVMVSEMNDTFDHEYLLITLITAVAVFLVVLLAFRNPTMPLILTLLVQCGVFITVAGFGQIAGAIYYLSLLVVQSILMGATIDYGIVFCNFYREGRKTQAIPESLRAAYEGSIHTIMTSGSILVFCLASLGIFATAVMVSEVCSTLCVGVLVTLFLILFVLPGLVACFDRLAIRAKKNVSPDTPI